MAQASVAAAGMTATEKLFAECWASSTPASGAKGISVAPSPQQAISRALTMLADSLDRDLPKGDGLKVHIAVMTEMSRVQCIQALSRAARETGFFPTPAELRRYAGLASSTLDTDAMQALAVVLEAMRRHGPELKALPGPALNDGRDADGLVLVVPLRGPATPAPRFEDAIEWTLSDLGFGSRAAGLETIAAHPALPWNSAPAAVSPFKARDAKDLEARWCQSYAAKRPR